MLARRSLNGDRETAYYLAHGPADPGVDELIRVVGAQWAIEECFLVGGRGPPASGGPQPADPTLDTPHPGLVDLAPQTSGSGVRLSLPPPWRGRRTTTGPRTRHSTGPVTSTNTKVRLEY